MNGSTESGPTEFWTRLRRRKVVQWGLVYVAGAWGFLQGLEYVSEAFQWPAQVRQIALLALLIGLPVVLVLAWYHGDRGQQRISSSEFGILALLLLLGGGAFWYYERASDSGGEGHISTAGPSQSSSSPVVSDPRPSIAVLPFENRSDVQKDAFFVDGIHDDILTQLSKVSALRVISRTSVEQFRDTKLPLREVAKQLGVTKILEGGVQRAGTRVRINVQLIDANTDAHLWADTYDRELTATNVFAIQAELAGAIADTLSLRLTPAEQARVRSAPTRNLEAWEAYQRGRRQMTGRTTQGMAAAVQAFERAIALDPKFAHAYAGLSDALFLQVDLASAPVTATMGRASEMLAVALRLDPELPEALTTSAKFTETSGDFATAESLYRRAIALDRNYAPAHQWYSGLLAKSSRSAEALSEARIVVELDPLSPVARLALADLLVGLGRFDEGVATFEAARRSDPRSPGAYAGLGRKLAQVDGRLDLAVPWLQKAAELDPQSANHAVNVAEVMLDLDDREGVREWLDIANRRSHASALAEEVAAMLSLYEGELEQSVQSARRAVASHGDAILINWPLALLRDASLRDHRAADAVSRYADVTPHLLSPDTLRLDDTNYATAVDLACALQRAGRNQDALRLLDAADAFIKNLVRQGTWGFGITDVRTLALRGKPQQALEALRAAEESGWRGPYWRYARDFDPALASIRKEPEFKAVFADIERDMAEQRARLAARPKDAPLELTETSR